MRKIFVTLIGVGILISPTLALASFSLYDSAGEIWYGYTGTPTNVDFTVYDCTSASTLHTNNLDTTGQANPYDLYGHAQLTGYGVTSGHDTVIKADDNSGNIVYHSFIAPDFTTDTGMDLSCGGGGGGGGGTSTSTEATSSIEQTQQNIAWSFLSFIFGVMFIIINFR